MSERTWCFNVGCGLYSGGVAALRARTMRRLAKSGLVAKVSDHRSSTIGVILRVWPINKTSTVSTE